MALTPGTLFDGRFAIEHLLGQGGMGAVYAARHQGLDRPVAIKVIHAQLGGDPQMRKRFRREARAIARVEHPYVPSIYDYGEDDRGQPYLVMELVAGQTLLTMVPSGGLELARALNILAQVAAALRAIHRCGIVHRDLKPGNVLITPHDALGDRVKVTDFGLAKLVGLEHSFSTEAGAKSFGSPVYMAPEQFDTSKPVDMRTDLYAFGVLAFQVLSGEPPFQADTLVGLARAHIYDVAPTLSSVRDVPAALDEIVTRCLAKDPALRYVGAGLLLDALRDVASQHAPSAQHTVATTLDSASMAATSATAPMAADVTERSDTETSVRTLAALMRALRERQRGDAQLLRGLARFAQSRDAVDQAEAELLRLTQFLAQFEQQQRKRRTMLQGALFELEREARSGDGAAGALSEPLDELRHHWAQLGSVTKKRLSDERQRISDWRQELERRRAAHHAEREGLVALLAPLAASETDPELLALFALAGV